MIVTNGPRTGQYNYISHKELTPNPHRTSEIDEVSKAFLDQLRELKIPLSQILFHNFNFQTLPSAYKPMLSWIATHQGTLYVPAESTSMVTGE